MKALLSEALLPLLLMLLLLPPLTDATLLLVLNAACAREIKVPAPTAVEKASGDL